MRRILPLMFLLLSNPFPSFSQTGSDIDAIMSFLGVDDPSEMDAEEVERLSAILESPVSLNSVHLPSCGLFTPYQVAVLEDYRLRHGDILTLLELSLLDGFGEHFVRKLRPFIILEPSGAKASSPPVHDLSARAGIRWRKDQGSDLNYAFRYRADAKERYSVTAAVSRGNDAPGWYPSAVSGSLLWKFRKRRTRLFVGDFNARFGQGLTLWNGAFMTGLTTPDAFMKKPSGLSQSWSFTGASAFTGLAADCTLGPFVVSSMLALPGVKNIIAGPMLPELMPALNVTWRSRHGQASLTNVYRHALKLRQTHALNLPQTQALTGLDAAFCIGGVNLFSELSMDWMLRKARGLAGVRFRAGEHLDIAARMHACQDEELGAALGGEFQTGSFVLDAAFYPVSKDEEDPWSLQLKSQLSLDLPLSPQLQLKARVTERVRTWGHAFRTDVRADLQYDISSFKMILRVNLLKCDGLGFLSYAEAGHAGERLAVYLRQGAFLIDDWDDRIYVYERDAPGTFNAPAMYGRGLWTSAVAGLKFGRSLRLYARAALTTYPFMEKKKPGKAELKLQIQCRF